MAANGIDDPRKLRVGQTLVIPGRRGGVDAAASDSPETWPGPSNPRQLAWPVIGGMVSSPFGMRHGVMHNGVDLVAPAGTPVHAADNGFVIFAGHLHGYGNVIILQHSDGYITVYGHNRRNLVHQGESVARGQVIAELGATGRASGPNLHFEVRYHNHPQNPLVFLPSPTPGTGVSFANGEGS
jgi:murein DD-endopeptidase MepM/ murein hydrolase activator NlpD